MRFAGTPDPRRRPQLALTEEPLASGLNRAAVPPGMVETEHIAGKGIDLASVVFDRASFAYDVAQHGPYTVAGDPKWTRVGLDPNDIRAYIGPTEEELYVWVWAGFGWANNNAAVVGDYGHVTACLYDGIDPLARERSANVISDWLPPDGRFARFDYQGFFKVPVVEGAEWSVGLQHSYGNSQHGGQTINRQSIIAFISAAPDDSDSNTTEAVAGDES